MIVYHSGETQHVLLSLQTYKSIKVPGGYSFSINNHNTWLHRREIKFAEVSSCSIADVFNETT